MTTATEMDISSISIGSRVRKDMGDIAALAASIEKHGLLHPPAVTSNGLLIAGYRRIQACASIGLKTVPVRIIDVSDLLSAERDENEVRKAFTPSEAVAIARVIEQDLKARAKANLSSGAKARWAKEKGESMPVGDSPTGMQQKSRSSASAAVGMCDQRYRQAKEIVEAAEQDAEKFGDIVETMDASNNVHGAFTELRRRRDKLPARHAVLKKMPYRDQNKEIQRAITTLSGLAMGIKRIDIEELDAAHIGEWAAEMKSSVAVINKFLKELNHECSK